MKYSFKCDYSEGAHPSILEFLLKTNLHQTAGYGEDEYCLQAAELIKKRLAREADVHFIPGGTQMNLIALASMLKPYESVIAPTTGHISVHEAGAIEATGHKINTVETPNGKLKPKQVLSVCIEHEDEHMVKPKVVFISNSTEVGTTYSKAELEALSKVCKERKLYLYLDGARLGSALTSSENDLNLSDIANLVDMFYIGGTKNGALIGEALVILNDDLKADFRRHIKQRGALLAKGRLLGIQFLKLFENNLFFDLAKHANQMAEKLTTGIKDLGYSFLTDSKTNQIFPVLPNNVIAKLEELYGFYVWAPNNETTSSIRLVTSWATEEKMVDEFLEDLKELS